MEGNDATWKPQDFSIVLDKGEASYVWDLEGNQYIDMLAGFGSLALGHNPEEVSLEALCKDKELVQGMGDVFPSKSKIDFIETLLSFLPASLEKVVLSNTGSQAVETAMKTAMLATEEVGFIAFQAAYHGLDLGALSLTSQSYFRKPFEKWLQGQSIKHVSYMCPEKELREAIQALKAKGVRLAGIIVEPVLGRGGFRPASQEWLELLRRVCDEESCLFILDEVFTGFGRCGRITFADSIDADLVCFGKAIGGGFPLSACVGKRKYMDAWPENKEGEAIHTGTYFGHPFSCRSGTQTLKAIRDLKLVEKVDKLGSSFLEKISKELSSFSSVKEVRGKGFMIAIEFHDPIDSLKVMDFLREEKVFVIPCGTSGECVSLTPALNVEEEILDLVLEKIKIAIGRLET